MKIKKNIGLISLLVMSLFGCNKEEDSSSDFINTSNNSSITNLNTSSSSSNTADDVINNMEVEIFIEKVELLCNEELTLDHKSQIDGTYFIYNSLTEDMKKLPEVIEAKGKLDSIKEEFLELYVAYLSSREAEETGYAFKELVESLGSVESLMREDKKDIDKLYKLYNNFSDATKQLSIVIEAKAQLDELNAHVNELINMSDEEYEIILFISMVNKLPSSDELTVYDLEIVQEVLDKYNSLPDASKENEKVINAKTKLDELNLKMEHLLVVKEHADAFVNAVYSLPTFSELEWQNVEQNKSITNVEKMYDNLTEEEKQVSSVKTAYKELQAIRNTYDNLKEPYDINKLDFAISLDHPADSINRKGTFTYANGKDHITVLTTYYGIPRDELSDHVAVYLNMYVEGGAVASQPLYSFDITEDYSGYDMNKYVEVLKQLRDEGNTKVKSGIGYTFAINIVSKNDRYASSKYSSFKGGQSITF